MKKILLIVLAISLILAGVAMATVVSSKHDLRLSARPGGVGLGSSNYQIQVCVFCHHPHRGRASIGGTGVQNDLLWNVSNIPAIQSWATYSSGTTNSTGMGGDMGATGQAITRACLSCHDGNVAIGSVVKQPADGPITASASNMPASSQLDTVTFEDDHPVDFTYPTAYAAGLEDIQLAGGNTITATDLDEFYLAGGTMQCSTCHSVHDPGPGAATGAVQFLRGNLQESDMCVDCHTAK